MREILLRLRRMSRFDSFSFDNDGLLVEIELKKDAASARMLTSMKVTNRSTLKQFECSVDQTYISTHSTLAVFFPTPSDLYQSIKKFPDMMKILQSQILISVEPKKAPFQTVQIYIELTQTSMSQQEIDLVKEKLTAQKLSQAEKQLSYSKYVQYNQRHYNQQCIQALWIFFILVIIFHGLRDQWLFDQQELEIFHTFKVYGFDCLIFLASVVAHLIDYYLIYLLAKGLLRTWELVYCYLIEDGRLQRVLFNNSKASIKILCTDSKQSKLHVSNVMVNKSLRYTIHSNQIAQNSLRLGLVRDRKQPKLDQFCSCSFKTGKLLVNGKLQQFDAGFIRCKKIVLQVNWQANCLSWWVNETLLAYSSLPSKKLKMWFCVELEHPNDEVTLTVEE